MLLQRLAKVGLLLYAAFITESAMPVFPSNHFPNFRLVSVIGSGEILVIKNNHTALAVQSTRRRYETFSVVLSSWSASVG